MEIYLISALVLFLIILFLLYKIIFQNKVIKELTTKLNNISTLKQEDEILIAKLSVKLEEQDKATQLRINDFKDNEEKLKSEFKNLATEIFDNNSKKFVQQNQEKLGDILNPMKQQLTDFKKKVEDVYDKEAKDRSALQNELKTLKELNQKISTEANNLTTALKGENKTQGCWGEMVLERVLENSGLRLGEEYLREVSIKNDDGEKYRPDVIVNLPNDRQVIIDAKTSLTSYEQYVSSQDKNEKQSFLNLHIKSINTHINSLSDKKYEDLKGVNTLDFIFMFIPIESALMLALENDKSLFDNAFKKKIVLVSPTTLLIALKAVENSWRYEKQAKNITEVYDRATKLYEKVEGFVSTLENVGKHIKKADSEYEKAFSQLKTGSGNVIRQVSLLKNVANIKTKNDLNNELVEFAMDNTYDK